MMVQVMETTLSSTGAEGQPLLCNGVAGAPGSSWPPEQGGGDCASPLHDGYRKALNRRDKNGDLLGSDAVISIELAAPERSEPRIVQEKFKTLVAFSFLSGNLILNLTCLAMVHERIPDRTKYPPLPDVFFDLFPPLDWALDVSEVIIIVCIWSTLLLLLIHRYRWIILQRVFLIMGLLYFMRSITMFVTQVPVASTTYYCSPKANTTNPLLILKRVAQLLSGFGLSINGQHTFCGDYIYSGHTVILTLAYLVVREYSPQRCKVVHITYLTLSCVGILMVLLSRGHYTVDVVIGYYVTTRLFWVYHTLANNQSLKNPSQNNYLARAWWFFIFSYFEKNVGAVVPRQYEWPLPWPRRWLPRTRIS
ncbi:phosphatidylcholine:ceramide cholinephosphotransferase 2 [Ixodes scapularis]|uniref:Spingomyelin synthetase, putative n=3 Tax=Ixodes TaxID=6944 RepID=B7QHG5_IXOSC|nr:phosphatidylcholine:ceramide cholinephosphotransferase 2 [Ixodes scapularis]XP_029836627.1 phosphatidylcholine:ceramide cholinephosphotransferase 2 [Ixodes scapularis]XP_042148256.1 phosphatidylcholine:ceramide cholinephosphotransferase 2 [Ixodes scapularis]EEC18287.1 spingomyelin synthetase, putative [Ixodes scapularis]|eukprot:XP_002414622.1 spingomyelin synthetase, putative [Ixodes scapularis]